MNTPQNDMVRRPDRAERGWVVVAALILASLAASVTVTWARHAVLAKSTLEMENGASSSEEAARSGLNRCREKMRQGYPPGTIDDGEEDVVITEDENIVTTEREVDDLEPHEKRRIKTHARKVDGDDMEEEACIRARAEIVPASEGRENGKKTRLGSDDCPDLSTATVISGTVTRQNEEIDGILVLEPGCRLTLDNVVLRGSILTRAGCDEDEDVETGDDRPCVELRNSVRILAGNELPDVAVVGPDCRITADSSSRVEVRGTTICDEIDIQGRGSVRGMVVHETSSNMGSKVKRPGHGRGSEEFSTKLKAGAEKVTRMSFPATGFSEDEQDAMEGCNAGNH